MNDNSATDEPPADEPTTELDIGLAKICFVISLAREFDSQTPLDERGDDDENDPELADVPQSPAYQELVQFLSGLNRDEAVALVALVWLGRDDYDAEDFADVLQEAGDQSGGDPAAYLTGVPLLADHLENALSVLDLNCEGMESGRE